MRLGPAHQRAAVAAAALLFAACTKLPEPDSQGARLYADRCARCHRAYQPSVMTFEMWKLVVARMQGVISRNGLPPLSPDEMSVLLDYLKRNAG